MTLAIDYALPPSSSGETLGLRVAVDDFLKAWFRHGKQERFVCRPSHVAAYAHFKELALAAGLDVEARCIGLDPQTPKQNLSGISCLFRPDPALADMAWRRQLLDKTGFSVCGLIHSLSGDQATRAVSDLFLAPTTASDALICPSKAIRDAVRKVWDITADYFNHRFGSAFQCPVQTPVIPIGIDTGKFAARVSPDKRKAQRKALGIGEDEVVILFVGRLSFVTKAHPLPLFLAVEDAVRRSGKKLRLVLYGYYKPQADMAPRFRALAQDFCKLAPCDIVTNDDPRFPDGLWAAADIFTSLVDNVQESFGLTPVEAMACGLPAVVSDWDGYRDGVRHGIDGFLIPTCAPPVEAGLTLAEQFFNHNNYGVYLAGAAQSTAVDISAAAAAFAELAGDAEKRSAMGASGQARAWEVYDWNVIIPAYEELWRELASMRGSQPEIPENWQAVHPHFPNPFEVFSAFSSGKLALNDKISVIMTNDRISLIIKHEMNLFVPELLPSVAFMRDLAEGIRRAGSVSVGDVLEGADEASKPMLWRCLGWMLKHGVCEVAR